MRRDVIAPHPMFVNFVRSLQFDLDVDWCHRVCSTVAEKAATIIYYYLDVKKMTNLFL